MTLDPNAPAYPVLSIDSCGKPRISCGITVRQHIAVQMAQSIISKHSYSDETIAILACKAADALIAELNKEQA